MDEDMPNHVAPPPTPLEDAVSTTLRYYAPPDSDGVAWLGAQTPLALVRLDERLRRWWAPPSEQPVLLDWYALGQANPTLRDAALFIATGSANGRVRQRSLQMCAKMPGKLTLAAALIRCNDWATPVRDAAQPVVMTLLRLCDTADVQWAWPLAVRLRDAGRADRDWIGSVLEPWLSETGQRSLLESLLSHPDGRTRRYAHSTAFNQDPLWAEVVRKRALHDPDPQVAKLAIRHVLGHASEEDIVALCRYALQAPSSQVRVEALRALAARDLPDQAALLDAAAFDRAGNVRSLVTWLRRDRGQGSTISLWRDELDNGGRGRVREALEGLADHAEAEDADRFRSAMRSMGLRGQRTCLRGLIRAEGGLGMSVLQASLDNANAGLRALVSSAKPLWSAGLSAEALASMGEWPLSCSAREQLLRRLAGTLSRWQFLELLLDFPTGGSREHWRSELIERWLTHNWGYSPLGVERRRVFMERLQGSGHGWDREEADRLARALESA
jgi:hypothetical protein